MTAEVPGSTPLLRALTREAWAPSKDRRVARALDAACYPAAVAPRCRVRVKTESTAVAPASRALAAACERSQRGSQRRGSRGSRRRLPAELTCSPPPESNCRKENRSLNSLAARADVAERGCDAVQRHINDARASHC